MSAKANLSIIVIALLLLGAGMSIFTVDERELAIKFRFGEIIQSDYEPGLHWKIPFVNNVLKFPDLILTRDDPPQEFLTSEKKNLKVDFFIKWRIVDPAQYYRSTGADETAAADRLLAIITDGIKAEFANRTVKQVVSAERSEIMDDMLIRASNTANELGIAVVDIRVKRIDLPDDVSDSVFQRMRQERDRTAKQLRAEGFENGERLRADADRQRTIILAEARRDAEKIRGAGDARSAEIYAAAYAVDPEFYSFYRSMQAYRDSLGQQDVMILEPKSEFFRYLSKRDGG